MIARSKKDINLWMQLSQNGYCILYNMMSAVSTSIRIGNNVAIWFTFTWKGCLKELAMELATEEEQAAKRRKVF